MNTAEVARGAAISVRQAIAINSHRAAAILRHVDRGARDALLTAMPLERANVLRGALSWPADSVAAHILPETLTVGPEVTAAQAIDEIRNRVSARGDEPHPGSYLYVCGAEQHLIGILTEDEAFDILEEDVVCVRRVDPAARSEKGARLPGGGFGADDRNHR